jgi:F0F1-type ATP synthase membrane subunit b/b'
VTLLDAFMVKVRAAEDARRKIRDALIDDAREHGDSLYDAANRLTEMMPKKTQAEARQRFSEAIEAYRREVADAAMWPAGKPPVAS